MKALDDVRQDGVSGKPKGCTKELRDDNNGEDSLHDSQSFYWSFEFVILTNIRRISNPHILLDGGCFLFAISLPARLLHTNRRYRWHWLSYPSLL